MIHQLRLPLQLFVLLAGSVAFAAPPGIEYPESLVRITGRTMGTTYSVVVSTGEDFDVAEATEEQLSQSINERLAELDRQMSTWRDDSEISQFNAWQSTDWFSVSADTAIVVREASRIQRMTGGAFDSTVAPLVELWGFGQSDQPEAIPDQATIDERLESVGDWIEDRDKDGPQIRKRRPNVTLNLSAIAKGYAVDEVARLIRDAGLESFMVEIGGEIQTGKPKLNGLWKIAIESPMESKRDWFRTLPMTDQAMATSGNYRNFFRIDDRRFAHTIDPRTGWPVEHKLGKHRLGSVTVLHQSCMTADALATGLMVMGFEDGFEFATENNLAVLFQAETDDGQHVAESTEEFERLENKFGQLEHSFRSARQARSNWKPEEQSTVKTMVVAFVVFGLVVVAMAVGVIFGRRALQGSCGGLNGEVDEQGRSVCSMCTKPSPDCSGTPTESETATS